MLGGHGIGQIEQLGAMVTVTHRLQIAYHAVDKSIRDKDEVAESMRVP